MLKIINIYLYRNKTGLDGDSAHAPVLRRGRPLDKHIPVLPPSLAPRITHLPIINPVLRPIPDNFHRMVQRSPALDSVRQNSTRIRLEIYGVCLNRHHHRVFIHRALKGNLVVWRNVVTPSKFSSA